MTVEVVNVSGFNVPPAQPGTERGTNPPINGGPNLPPLNPTPGFNTLPQAPNAITSQPQVQQPAPQVQQPQVQPAKQEPAAPALNELTGVPTSDLRNFDVGTIEDPVIQSMAQVLITSAPDIDLDRALANAIKYGNADLIDVAYLKEKGGAQGDQLASIAKGLVTQIAAKAEANVTAVFNIAGGEAQWDQSVAAFNQHAPQALRDSLTFMLDSGNSQWISAAAQSIVDFAKQSGAVPNPTALVQTGGAALSTAQALSKQQFQAEMAKLNRNSQDYAAQSDALMQRRQLGKNLGL
jgi:hypothetical protein